MMAVLVAINILMILMDAVTTYGDDGDDDGEKYTYNLEHINLAR